MLNKHMVPFQPSSMQITSRNIYLFSRDIKFLLAKLCLRV